MSNVVSLYPTLDMYNDDMVYIIAKIKSTDPSGWVLVVNTANKKLEKISPFLEESFNFWRIYLQCDFSKHLSKVPGDPTEMFSIYHTKPCQFFVWEKH